MYRLIVILMSAIVVVACTPNPQVTDAPFFTATPRPINTLDSPANISGTAIPLDFSGGDPVVLGDIGTFSLSVTGEFTQETDAGTVLYNFLPNDGVLPARNQLSIATNNGQASTQLSIQFDPEIIEGQYAIVAPDEYTASNVSASYDRLIFDGTVTRIQPFAENVEGVITFTSVGEILSGEFTFTTDFTEIGTAGEVDVQSIEVSGTFQNVPYIITREDPFENTIPLPTRNFSTGTDQP